MLIHNTNTIIRIRYKYKYNSHDMNNIPEDFLTGRSETKPEHLRNRFEAAGSSQGGREK